MTSNSRKPLLPALLAGICLATGGCLVESRPPVYAGYDTSPTYMPVSAATTSVVTAPAYVEVYEHAPVETVYVVPPPHRHPPHDVHVGPHGGIRHEHPADLAHRKQAEEQARVERAKAEEKARIERAKAEAAAKLAKRNEQAAKAKMAEQAAKVRMAEQAEKAKQAEKVRMAEQAAKARMAAQKAKAKALRQPSPAKPR